MQNQGASRSNWPVMAAFISAMVLAFPVLGECPPKYSVTHLGSFPNHPRLRPTAINSAGDIVGAASNISGSNHRAFLWSNGTLTDLGSFGGFATWAYDLNDLTHVVGSSFVVIPDPAAFIWNLGAMTPLPEGGSDNSYAFAINNVGQIVGVIDGQRRPVIWENIAGVWMLNLLPDINPAQGTTTADINDAGQIVGFENGGFNGTPLLWERVKGQWTVTELPSAPDADAFEARAINQNGTTIVGILDHRPTDTFRPAMWQKVKGQWVITDLGPLVEGGNFVEANDVNNANQIVGHAATTHAADFHAFFHQNGQMYDLNDLISPNSGWLLQYAISINEDGLITGYGELNGARVQAFLLTPVESRLGDINGDDVVNVDDLLDLIGAWGPCTTPCPADLNCDDTVNVNDLLILIGNWG